MRNALVLHFVILHKVTFNQKESSPFRRDWENMNGSFGRTKLTKNRSNVEDRGKTMCINTCHNKVCWLKPMFPRFSQ